MALAHGGAAEVQLPLAALVIGCDRKIIDSRWWKFGSHDMTGKVVHLGS